jgi:hypothetical protein
VRAGDPSNAIIESDRIQCVDHDATWPEKAQRQRTAVGTFETNPAAERGVARATNRNWSDRVQPPPKVIERSTLYQGVHFVVESSSGELPPRQPS